MWWLDAIGLRGVALSMFTATGAVEAFAWALFFYLSEKYAIPWLSKIWARVSAPYRRRRIERLTKDLEKYESDLADGRLFIARIVYRATIAMVLAMAGVASFLYFFLLNTSYDVICEFLNNCRGIPVSAPVMQLKTLSLIFYIVGGVFFGHSATLIGALRDEIAPEKYRSRLKDRIARYSNRG
jgi:hypothetical protein